MRSSAQNLLLEPGGMGSEETLVTPICIYDLGLWDRTAYGCMLAGVVRDRLSAAAHFCVAAV